MAKKRRHKDDYEFRLEEEIRQLKALNRSLLKELKKRNKGVYRSEIDLTPEYEENDKPSKPKIDWCPECSRGQLEDFEIAGRIFKVCKICQYRKKLS